jgi:tetratricopeptide (TPR) repeat protein
VYIHLGEAQLSLYSKGVADWRKEHGDSPMLGTITSDIPGAQAGGSYRYAPQGGPVLGETDMMSQKARIENEVRNPRFDPGHSSMGELRSPVAAMNAAEREQHLEPARAALASFGKALTIDPGSPGALKGRAYSLFALEEFGPAADAFEKAAAAAKTNDALYQMAGDAYARADRPDDSIRMWEEVIRIEPARLRAYRNLVALYASFRKGHWESRYYEAMDRLVLGKPVASLDGLKWVTENHPDFALGWRGLGSAYLAMKDGANAVKCLEKATEVDPKDGLAEYELGAALILGGEAKQAHSHLMKAAQMRPDYAPVWFALGQQAEKDSDPDTAIAMYERALENRPNWADAHYSLGALYLDKHESAPALQHLERYLALKPDAPDSKDVRKVVDQIRAMK